MRLELSQAISLILALPAHRSNNEGHRKLGDKALEFLFEYKDLGKDEKENEFNRAMIASILSAVRAFSVERDRIGGEWKAIEEISIRRERLLEVFRNLSLLSKDNYWSKALAVILALGFSLPEIKKGLPSLSFKAAVLLVILLVVFEIISKVAEFLFAKLFEKKIPIEKATKWQEESLNIYKNIVKKFINESLETYKRFYPERKLIQGFDITKADETDKLKVAFIKKHFYLDNEKEETFVGQRNEGKR